MKAIAMLARGDVQRHIAQELEISEATVTLIKNRNQEALQTLRERLQDRSHELAVLNHTRALERLNDRLENPKDIMATKDLVAVSREMFNEKQINEGKPTQIAGNLNVNMPANYKNLKTLVEAIENGDDIVMSQLIFDPAE